MQFQAFLSSPDVSFWHTFAKYKLEVAKLSEDPVEVRGYYSNDNSHNALPARLSLQAGSFGSSEAPPFQFPVPGVLHICNTIERFKESDKKALLSSVGQQIWEDILSGAALEDPSKLLRFLLLSYGDLKKYRFHYWFAFPALNFSTPLEATEQRPLFEYWTDSQRAQLQESYEALRGYQPDGTVRGRQDDFAFLIVCKGEAVLAKRLCEWREAIDGADELLVGVADPSGADSHAGWPVRNLAVLIAVQMREVLKEGGIVKMVLLRQWRKQFEESSFVVSVRIPVGELEGSTLPALVGWERDGQAKLRPRFVDLSATMNPEQLAASQTSLNLQLMKWRLMPALDLERIANTKCLLVGAGTLGCNVARALMAWGVQHITFIDNGTVSFSNPVRQTLFTFEDCLNGGRPKAEVAAEALRKILPTIQSHGRVLSIPMPGHSVTKNMVETVRSTIQEIDQLFEEADVVFQLTDSREARWFPTLLCAAKNKPCINAALGFDTFLAMRHGCSPLVPLEHGGKRVGCYFCNDITGPSDSLRNRTLDQQCTVTRPGVSMLASSCAVELMVLLLQHPLGNQAPPDVNMELGSETSTALGNLPHQIRGFLSHFRNILTEGYDYERCTACSETVVRSYLERGADLVLDVMERSSLLEDLTGLTAILADDTKDCISWDEEDLD